MKKWQNGNNGLTWLRYSYGYRQVSPYTMIIIQEDKTIWQEKEFLGMCVFQV